MNDTPFWVGHSRISAKIRLMTNSKLSGSYRMATAVEKAHTVAEWEPGMPPLPTNLSATNCLVKKTNV